MKLTKLFFPKFSVYILGIHIVLHTYLTMQACLAFSNLDFNFLSAQCIIRFPAVLFQLVTELYPFHEINTKRTLKLSN